MIRDSIEKTIINPTENDIISLRQQAFDSVAAMGAVPESIEVTVEIDSKNKKVIAVAMGSSEMRSRDVEIKALTEADIKQIASLSMRTTKDKVIISGSTSFFYAITFREIKKHLFGLVKDETQKLRVIDREGTIKLQLNDALCEGVEANSVKAKIKEMISALTTFGDAGALVPDIFLLVSSRIVDFTGLINESQIMALVDFELSKIPQNEKIIVIASPKK
jgi:N-methylhydantoinase A